MNLILVITLYSTARNCLSKNVNMSVTQYASTQTEQQVPCFVLSLPAYRCRNFGLRERSSSILVFFAEVGRKISAISGEDSSYRFQWISVLILRSNAICI